MASASKKTSSSCCFHSDSAPIPREAAPAPNAVVSASVVQDWTAIAGSEDRRDDQRPKKIAMASLIPESSANASTTGMFTFLIS